LGFDEKTLETVEATLPGVATLSDPSLGRLQCVRLDAANANPPGFPGAHQARERAVNPVAQRVHRK
jgi:hypothetical protein